jgi:2-polyprenyl-3-methyl-5-hydroxy-6-metoxy-1,4-benzoquinol methylase
VPEPSQFEAEVRRGDRFEFGRNWASFLEHLTDQRVERATESLRRSLRVESLAGKSFLDIGSGSGLFSLAAHRLGARVVSIDFDPQSVACTEALRARFATDDANWTIHRGSALDADFLASLGEFGVVYSWGVLHHTGRMWDGVELATQRVAPGGRLFLALYNDQGWLSRFWLFVKQCYCRNRLLRAMVLTLFVPYFAARTALKSLLHRRNEFAAYFEERGMSIVHDWIDWLGGLPFEVAGFESVVEFCQVRGFELTNSRRTRRLGCNEFIFVRR